MTQTIKTVMILGGRGHLGPFLISSLLKAGFSVTVLSHSSSETSSAIHNVPVVRSDYTFPSLVNSFQGQDAVVCIIPSGQIEEQQKIIDAAVAAKVKRFLPNEYGADTSLESLGPGDFFFKPKKQLVAYLKQKEIEGLSWTALCTGPWIDWILMEGQGLLGFNIRTKTGTLFDSGNEKFTGTTVMKVGEATAAVLLHPEQTKNQYVHVDSFKLSQNIILEALEKASGSRFVMDKMKASEIFDIGKKAFDENDWDGAYYKLVTGFVCSGHEALYFPEKAEGWNKLLGLGQDETVEDMAARVLALVSA